MYLLSEIYFFYQGTLLYTPSPSTKLLTLHSTYCQIGLFLLFPTHCLTSSNQSLLLMLLITYVIPSYVFKTELFCFNCNFMHLIKNLWKNFQMSQPVNLIFLKRALSNFKTCMFQLNLLLSSSIRCCVSFIVSNCWTLGAIFVSKKNLWYCFVCTYHYFKQPLLVKI